MKRAVNILLFIGLVSGFAQETHHVFSVYFTSQSLEVLTPIPNVNSIYQKRYQLSEQTENKMRVAKQFSKNKCLTVDQIRQVAQLFSFSEDIMEYVKFAYPNCMNKDDYYELMEVFTFSGDKEELERFLDAQ